MKKAQFSFVWIFALVVGGAILFLAIYGAMQAGDTASIRSNTETAKSIAILTDPLQAGFSDGSFGRISFKENTKINNICNSNEFGNNIISVAVQSGKNDEWSLAGSGITVSNKYIFSSEADSGKDFYVFSKPFYFPYKVADLTFLILDNYCFVGANDDVADEIIGLNMPNIEIENCTLPNSIRVCFSSNEDCDITVDNRRVEKGSDEMEYVGNLMYAAIFSDKDIYNCNVERLKYRAAQIAEEFSQKADLMSSRGCGTSMAGSLKGWSIILNNSNSLVALESEADELDKMNENSLCRVWS